MLVFMGLFDGFLFLCFYLVFWFLFDNVVFHQFFLVCKSNYLGVTGIALGDGVTGGMFTLGDGVTGLGNVGLFFFIELQCVLSAKTKTQTKEQKTKTDWCFQN